jgi:hypothetical protein
MLRSLPCLLLFAITANAFGSSESVAEVKRQFSENYCWSKGHIGIIHPGLYIVTQGQKNELALGQFKRWTGLPAGSNEVVVAYKDQIWDRDKLPADYSLKDSAIISFEKTVIRFVDFRTNTAGFYVRESNP